MLCLVAGTAHRRRDLGTSVSGIGIVASAPILDNLIGLALLVPMTDRVRSNRLMAAQLSGRGMTMGLAAGQSFADD